MTDRVKTSTHAESVNGEAPRRQTPTEFARELAMAYATKEPIGRSQTVTLGAPATGALAGQLIVSHVSLNRDEGETLAAWMTRVRLTTAEALKLCLVFNDPDYRDELLREALAEIRNPEKVA